MNIRTLIIGIGLFLVAQGLSWFQTNGQFLNVWIKNNPFWVALVFGVPVGMAYIYGTTYIVESFNGQLWPSRLLGFATGIFAFTFLSYVFMGEGINTKTAISLVLATTLVSIQIFWK